MKNLDVEKKGFTVSFTDKEEEVREMKKEVILYDDLAEGKHKFLDNLLKNCYIDHFTGYFYCKKCKSLVHVDWYRNLAFCKAHIFSRFGITYIEELYKICIKIDDGVDQRS